MGKYVLNYTGFINESADSVKTTAESIIAAAGKYIDTKGYASDNYSTAEKLSVLTDELAAQIRSEDGDAAADAFMEEAMNASMSFVAEESCPTCAEMMEPCDACKQHSEEMKEAEEA